MDLVMFLVGCFAIGALLGELGYGLWSLCVAIAACKRNGG
jgi:hypothetical protein